MTRRQFLKGSGLLAVTVIVSGIFAKIGIDAFAAGDNYIAQRAAGLYSLDEKMALRKSHENPEIIEIYREFLSPGEEKYLSAKAHHLLHTKYGKNIPAFIEELKAPGQNENSHEAA